MRSGERGNQELKSTVSAQVKAFLAIGVLLLGCQPARQPAAEEVTAPFVFPSLVELDGQPFDTAALGDDLLILNVWATWCKPCIQEMPALSRMQKQLPKGYRLILASDESEERIRAFAFKRTDSLHFVRLLTPMDALGVYSLPTTLVLDAAGTPLDTLVGMREWDNPEQIRYLVQLKNR